AAQHGRPPGLGIVLVGNDPASEVYVRNKLKAGTDIGFRTDLERLPASATLADTLALVDRLNRSAPHDGILVQSPLPKAMGTDAEQRVFDSIAPGKDVDGLTPVNVGLLVQKRATLVACTPSGIMEMLEREKIPVSGRHAIVIGRSEIVGKPMALLLLHRDATVIDVGMNKVTDSAVAQMLFRDGHPRLQVFRSKGSVLVGDVHPEVAEVA